MPEEISYKGYRIRIIADLKDGGFYAKVLPSDSEETLLKTDTLGVPVSAEWEAEFLIDNHLPGIEESE